MAALDQLQLTVLSVSSTHTGTSLPTATTNVDVKPTGMVLTVLTTSVSVILNVTQNTVALALMLVTASAVTRTHGCAQMVPRLLWDLSVTVWPIGQAKTATIISDLVTASVKTTALKMPPVTDQDQRTVCTALITPSVTETEHVSVKKTGTFLRTVISIAEPVTHAVNLVTAHSTPIALKFMSTLKLVLMEAVNVRLDGLAMTAQTTTVLAHAVVMDALDLLHMSVYN